MCAGVCVWEGVRVRGRVCVGEGTCVRVCDAKFSVG